MSHPYLIRQMIDPPPAEPPKDLQPKADPVKEAVSADVLEDIEKRRRAAETQGYEKGLQKGREEAMKRVREDLVTAVEALQAVARRIEQEFAESRATITDLVLKSGVLLAETLVGSHAIFDRTELRERILAEAMSEAQAEDDLVIICRTNPETIAFIRSSLPDSVVLVEDTDMRVGGFVVEVRRGPLGTPLGRWDASFERIGQILRELQADE